MAGRWTGSCTSAATDIGTVSGSSTGTTITAASSANTKGSYTQLVASTSADCSAVALLCSFTSLAANEYSIDFAVGGAGSEQVLIADVIVFSSDPAGLSVVFPVSIPSGTRVAARCQATTANSSINVAMHLMDSEFTATEGSAQVTTIGFNSATTTGTTVDPGAVANTKGSWAQLTASTANDVTGVVIAIDALAVGSGSSSENIQMLLDIGVGGAGSEQVIVPNLAVNKITQNGGVNAVYPTLYPVLPVSIPSGTRVAARAQATSTTSGSRNLGVVLYGVRL